MEGDEVCRREESSTDEGYLKEAFDREIGMKASIVAKEHPEAGLKYYTGRLPFLPMYRSYSGEDLTVTWKTWEKELKEEAERNPEAEVVVGGEHQRKVTYNGELVYRDTAEFPRYRQGGANDSGHLFRFKGSDGRQRYHILTPIEASVDVELYEPGEWEDELDRLYREVREQG